MKAYEFCVENLNKDTTPKYVKAQMQDFINICDDKVEKYIISKLKLKQLENILKLLKSRKKKLPPASSYSNKPLSIYWRIVW